MNKASTFPTATPKRVFVLSAKPSQPPAEWQTDGEIRAQLQWEFERRHFQAIMHVSSFQEQPRESSLRKPTEVSGPEFFTLLLDQTLQFYFPVLSPLLTHLSILHRCFVCNFQELLNANICRCKCSYSFKNKGQLSRKMECIKSTKSLNSITVSLSKDMLVL